MSRTAPAPRLRARSVPGDTATVTITVDRTFAVPGDHRRLGVILSEVGFRPAEVRFNEIGVLGPGRQPWSRPSR